MWASLRLLVFAVVSAGPLSAQVTQPPMVTDRPDFTESASAVAPGHLQLEAGYTFTRSDDVDEHTLGELLFRIGLWDRIEGRIGVNSIAWVNDGDDAGIEDPSLAVKVVLAKALGWWPAIAILAGSTLPVGGDDIGEDDWQPGVTGALAWDLSDRLGLSANLGYTYASEDDEQFDQGSASLALGFGLTARTGAYVEVFSIFPAGDNIGDDVTLNGGVTYLVDNSFQLDARVGAGLTGDAPGVFIGFGVARRW